MGNYREPFSQDAIHQIDFYIGESRIDLKKALTIPRTLVCSLPYDPPVKDYYVRAAQDEKKYKSFEYILKSDPKAKILFFYAADFYRDDHYPNFQNVCRTVKHKDILYPKALTPAIEYPSSEQQALQELEDSWRHKFLTASGAKEEYAFLPLYLLRMHKAAEVLSCLDIKKYSLLVVYYDVCPSENMLVQVFQQAGIPTATLQHGVFKAPLPHPRTLEETGIALSGHIADCFLVWNRFTKAQALLAGIPRGQIFILGIPKFIHAKAKAKQKEQPLKGRFGLILGGVGTEAQNYSMIQIANELAESRHLSFCIKCHPSLEDQGFSNAANPHYFCGLVSSATSIPEYSRLVDFTLVGNSSVYIELLYLRHPTYHLHDPSTFDVYDRVGIGAFQTTCELENAIQNGSTPLKILTRYLCGPSNSFYSYSVFFTLFLNLPKKLLRFIFNKGRRNKSS